MADFPTARIIYDRRRKTMSGANGSVEIEVYAQGKRKWYSTGVVVPAQHWHHEYHVVGTMDASVLNARISARMQAINKYLLELAETCEDFSFSSLDAMINQSVNANASFIEFAEEYVRNAKLAPSTKRKYDVLIEDLREYGKLSTFADLKEGNIRLYDQHLHEKAGGNISDAGCYNYHKCMKPIIKSAIEKQLLRKNPYDNIKIKMGKPKIPVHLELEEVQSIEKVKTTSSAIAHVKDLFLFQCYTGLAYVDTQIYDFRLYITKKDGKYILQAPRVKTKITYYVVLLEPALRILQKYNYQLPKMTNQVYNRFLAVLKDAAGITKHVTTHVARHTFACIALNNDVPLPVIQAVLGHKTSRSTLIYAKIVNKKVEKEFDRLGAVFK